METTASQSGPAQTHTQADAGAPASNAGRAASVAAQVQALSGLLAQAGRAALPPLRRAVVPLAVAAAVGLALHTAAQWRIEIPRGEQLVRRNAWSDAALVLPQGTAWVVPGVHTARLLPAQDLHLRASKLASYRSPQAPQTVEGLSIGLEVNLRVALDDRRLPELAARLPDAINADLVEPVLAGILYAQISQYTVRELFSSQRGEIQRRVQAELSAKLAKDGLVLKDLQFGAIDLPPDYRKGLDTLLAEGLASDKMRFTLELKEKLVKQTALEAQADRERREIQAEASAREQVIAAKAQEEAMKHVLPFKQRQIEQRQLEAEAERQSRVRIAEGASQARQIEADGEAKARRKLADAEAYRVSELGKVASTQMEREGRLISRHPLLVQKALVDKLGDKIQVIVAPPGTSGQLLAGISGRAPAAAKSDDADAEGE